jgi:hypothetical protein
MTRLICVALGLSGALALALPAASAGAAPTTSDTGQVSINTGSGWTHHPTKPLFDFTRIVPGWSGTAILGVRNDSDTSALLALKVTDVVDKENGCNHSESLVDTTCTGDAGELGGEIVLTVYGDADNDGSYDPAPAWTGSIRDLDHASALGDLTAGASRNLEIVAGLPVNAGNETQSDQVSFDLLVSLNGAGVAVEGTKTTRAPGGGLLGRAIDQLPFTGTPAERLVAFALSLLLMGAALTLGAQHWRRPQSV